MKTFSYTLAGRELIIETGLMARQANGSVLVRYGDTAVLVAATQSTEPRLGIDFFPLTVDYEERLYAVGKIPGGFIKREGRPSEAAILAGRLIDRPIRPLFDDSIRNDTQIVATVLSVDQSNPPDITAMIGASCALSISDICWDGPIAGVRVGHINGQFVINPSAEQLAFSQLNLVVAGNRDAVLMVEAGASEVSEQLVLEAIDLGHQEIKKLVKFISGIQREVGKAKKEAHRYAPPPEIAEAVRQYVVQPLTDAIMNSDKLAREANMAAVKKAAVEHFAAIWPDNLKDINYVIGREIKSIVRRTITVDKIRPDGRGLDEIRPIDCRVGVFARTHGSSLFTRGQTQVMNIATLGCIGDEQILDGLGIEDCKRYMHNYNFPPYSVG
ncbi:MAG: polyribonucleotide nucleotidyltransferase, partial [Negativicutes bacterium]|nr:polyribonucleotide nucleotidyltransferase [Negativicutes bacterium]